MKQYLTLRNALKIGAVVLAIVAFCLMFGDQLTFKNVADQTAYVSYNTALFGEGGAIISFVGYLLILIGGLIGGLLILLKTSDNVKRYITLGVAVLVLVGAVFVFIEAAVFKGDTLLNYKYSLNGFPIAAGILGVLAGAALGASEFVPDMQFVK